MSAAGCHYCGLPLRLSQYGESYYCTRACWHLALARATRLRGDVASQRSTPTVHPDKATGALLAKGCERPEGAADGLSSLVVSLLAPFRRILGGAR